MDIGNVRNRTLLPLTCGEETDLPGIPSVGCATSVTCRPGAPDSFSVCVFASTNAVSILGPNLDKRRNEEALTTRQVWKVPAVPSRVAEALGEAAASEATAAHIVSITAFMLSDEDSVTGSRSDEERAMDESLGVLVAWGDAHGQHHVSLLVVSLTVALSPSLHVDDPRGDFCPCCSCCCCADTLALRPQQRVLRLFCVPAVKNDCCQGDCLLSRHVVMCSMYELVRREQQGAGEALRPSTASSGRTRVGESATLVGNIMYISLDIYKGMGATTAAQEDIAQSQKPTTGAGAKIPGASSLPPLRTVFVMEQDSFGSCWKSCTPNMTAAAVATPNPLVSALVGCASPSVVPTALWEFAPGRPVCAFAVQYPQVKREAGCAGEGGDASILAAAGTIDGRLYLLRRSSGTARLARRLAGPVADLCFVDVKASVDVAARSRTVDDLLDEAMQKKLKDSGLDPLFITNDGRVSPSNTDGGGGASLVVLDSAGRVVVLRSVNSGAPIPQIVQDIPQVVTLARQPSYGLGFVAADSSASSPATANVQGGDTHVTNSKSFLDLSTLRLFFGRSRRSRRTRLGVSGDKLHPAPNGNAVAGASPIVTNESGLSRLSTNTGAASLDDDGTICGHILSRGLLCLTHLEKGRGTTELIVSTMGQVVVSIPFDRNEGAFSIAGFTTTPAPMHYVGVIDFFANGCGQLVMASIDNVLVARRPRAAIKERAQMLLNLLERKHAMRSTQGDSRVDKQL